MPPAARRGLLALLTAAAVAVVAALAAAAVAAPLQLAPGRGLLASDCDRSAPSTARAAVGLFLQSAVERDGLGASYGVAYSSIRGKQSCAEWRSGTIAVVPFPHIDWQLSGIARAWCSGGRVLFAVQLVAGDGALPDTLFLLGLRPLAGGTWVVDYWLPALPQVLPERPLVPLDDFVGGGAGAAGCGLPDQLRAVR